MASSGNGCRSLFRIFYSVSKDNAKFREIRDGGNAKTSKTFGVQSIVFIVLAVVAVFLLTLCISAASKNSDNIVVMLLLILGMVATVLATVLFFFRAVFYAVFQMRLNRGAISWIAMTLIIAAIVAAALIFIFLLGR